MSSKINILSPIISVEWLNSHLYAADLVVLDGTINKEFDSLQQQIPSSRIFDIKNKFSDISNEFPSAFPSSKQFQKEARALGINNDSAIVVSDDKGIYSSARVWWMFKAFGFNNVAILNGGFPAWIKAGYSTETMSLYSGDKGNFTANSQPNRVRFFEDVKTASENKTHIIIDARSSERFNCEIPEPREGLRMGTIPNSKNLPFTNFLEDGFFKPKVDLEKALYMHADKNDPIIFSCGSGITACILALGAEISGYKNVSVYDGSWTEWGSLTSNDINNPEEWTKNELLAYILIYMSHLDLNETRKEYEYILTRVNKGVYKRVYNKFKTDNDYECIQNIIKAIKTHDYYRNDFSDLFADIKLMAFVDGDFGDLQRVLYVHLKKILKDA